MRVVRLVVALGVAACIVAAGAVAVDVYIKGEVVGRVPGKNAANVTIRWDFKCLGDKLGAATYEYTLVAVRQKPAPEQKVTIREDTTKKGSTRTVLGPGTWVLIADPFLCETERGAGSTQPEVGAPVVVPDYCSWTVRRATGAVEVQVGAAVKRGRPGAAVPQGGTVATPAGGGATLQTAGADASAALGPGTTLGVERGSCATRGGWRLSLARGTTAVAVKAGPDASRPHELSTPNALTSGTRASWSVAVASKGGSPVTTVRVTSGSVRLAGRKGAPVVLAAGQRGTVTGTGAAARG